MRGVQLEADGLDVAVLLAAQQVAGAAQFQIERGNLEARAQVAELLQRGQALVARARSARGPAESAGRHRRGGWSGPRVRATGTAPRGRGGRRG